MTSCSEKTHFFLRKLHSLTGLMICGFILEHFFTNSASIHALFGNTARASETFNTHVNFLHSLPALPLIELLVLAGPFLFHIFYGIYIFAFTGRNNAPVYPYVQNFCYTLQRFSGIIIMLFLLVHVLELRFGVPVLPGNDITHSTVDPEYKIKSEVIRYKADTVYTKQGQAAPQAETVIHNDYYRHVENYFGKIGKVGVGVYLLGIFATAFHFGNGLFLAGITWGVWTRRGPQQMAFKICMLIAVLAALVGSASVAGFLGVNICECSGSQ